MLAPASLLHVHGATWLTRCAVDFLVTLPFSFIAERWGVRFVLLCNLVPRMGVSIWAVVVGRFEATLDRVPS